MFKYLKYDICTIKVLQFFRTDSPADRTHTCRRTIVVTMASVRGSLRGKRAREDARNWHKHVRTNDRKRSLKSSRYVCRRPAGVAFYCSPTFDARTLPRDINTRAVSRMSSRLYVPRVQKCIRPSMTIMLLRLRECKSRCRSTRPLEMHFLQLLLLLLSSSRPRNGQRRR